MKWDKAKVSTKKVVLSEEDSCATSSSSAWTSLLASDFLSEGIYEVTIDTVDVDNPSLFIGVASPKYWDAVVEAAKDGEEALPRDSTECICMHGDGRCFIKSQEKDWGLQKMASNSSLRMVLDFPQGVVSFKLERVVRGKLKETVAEIPGLFPSATIVACLGGRDQQLVLSSCERRTADEVGEQKKVRDVFDGLGEEKVARLQLEGNTVGGTYAEQIAAVASMSEGSM